MENSTQHPSELLPFYANGTLEGDELKSVESHISNCEHCQRELALLKTMRTVSKAEIPEVANEFAWQRLKRDMKKSASHTGKDAKWWRPALATAAALIIVLQTTIIMRSGGVDDTYRQAGQYERNAVAQVKFNPNAREEDIRKALLELDVEIIAGPSAAGVYRIKLTQLKDDPAAEEKFKALRDKKLLINYVARE